MFKIKNINLIYFSSIMFYIIFAIFRSREILLNGRFFAEEGSVFWSYSLSEGALNILQYVPVIQGYFCFNCNLQIYLSTLVPITYSPLVTVWVSIFISLLPSFFFYQLTDKTYENSYRILASITILFLPSLNLLEVFANSINSQVYFAVCCLVILLYGLDEKKYLKLQYLILIISFLSSYYALILLPAFFIKYLLTRNSKLLPALYFGLISSIIQINVLIYSAITNSIYEGKLEIKGGLAYLIDILKLSFSINIFGEKYFRNLSPDLFGFLIFVFLIYFAIKKKNDSTLLIIMLVYMLQIFLVIFGQAGSSFSQRYAVVTSTVAFFLFIHIFGKSKSNSKIILYFLIVGLLNFNFQGGSYFIECNENCTIWSEQVKEVKEGSRELYVHWPMGEGNPYWFTDAKNPRPNPAPFQKEIIGDEYMTFYNLTLVDVFRQNIQTVFND